jgi:hypothetical protein
MTDGSKLRYIAGDLNRAGMDRVAGVAGQAAEDADRRHQELKGDQVRWGENLKGLREGIEDGKVRVQLLGIEVPEGFEPFGSIRSLLKMGRWPLCTDSLPVILPSRELLTMGSDGRIDASSWESFRKDWEAALAGDADAQFALGQFYRETHGGVSGHALDIERAFFWFYRAGMQGHIDARVQAEAIMSYVPDFDKITAAPEMVFPFKWLVRQDKFGEAIITMEFQFEEDGKLTGRTTDFGGTAAEQMKEFAHHPLGRQAYNALFGAELSGRWTFSREARVLTLTVVARVPGAVRPSPPEVMRIELVAAVENGIYPGFFGKGSDMFSYIVSPIVEQQTT